MTDAEMLELAAELARRAAAAIEAVRAAGFVIDRKSDESPVTEADRLAETIIVDGLREALPEIPVVAEEEVAAGIETAVAPEYWLVDPLDGTRGFAAGRPEYAVCIGLVRDGRAVLGAIALPPTGELFGGLLGEGAWVEDEAGERRPIAVRTPAPDGLVVLVSRQHAGDPRFEATLGGRPMAERRGLSSALKFCRVAAGEADLYPRFGQTMEWDTAAGQAIVEAAGGRVTDLAGAPLRYGKPGWLNDGFVCHGGT